MSNKNYKEIFELFVKDYLSNAKSQKELEIRFGTKYYNPITRIKFENVIQKLKSLGFKLLNNNNSYHLNIQNQFDDPNSGKTKMSNVRTEIKGFENIQQFCNTNNINEKITSFMQKTSIYIDIDKEKISKYDNNDFQFRINYKNEKIINNEHPLVKIILDSWNDSKKTFRFIKRFSFKHKDYPFIIDCSVVKTSKKNQRSFYLIPEYTIQASNVFNNPEFYEIELELLKNNEYNKLEWSKYNFNDVMHKIRTGIKIILSGLQQTNYPISYSLMDNIKNEYLSLINVDKKEKPKRRLRTSDFIGFSSISLEMDNIVEVDKSLSNIPNINNYYTVTEKADGIRKLLFINKNGLMYFIDTNMNIQFMGCKTTNKSVFNSIIDGEHVLNDKNGSFINLYLCFDIYFINKKDKRQYPLCESPNLKYPSNVEKDVFRLKLLFDYLNKLNHVSVTKNAKDVLDIKMKTFYNNNTTSIFEQCGKILTGIEDGTMFNYETDGLIFTPSDKSVSSDRIVKNIPSKKMTWVHSMKWKPAEFNTIDFLVTTKKNQDGSDFVGNIFESGNNTSMDKQTTKYKTLYLKVGFDENRHGYVNPCKDIIEDNLPSYYNENNKMKSNYYPKNFQPYDPSPNFPIHVCNILIKNNLMFTENGVQTFQDETIVEFRFDKSAKKYWQWVPIRVRHDKTSDYKKGLPNYGNAYHVAQSVWKSIHNPITVHMLSSGQDIPTANTDDNVYYNRKTNESYTKSLRDFHNKYIKRKLIKNVSSYGDNLVDQSVGKGGDLPKWIESRLNFVFGIDEKSDNIHNRIDGACARYLNMCKKYRSLPSGLFIHGDSSKNIKSGKATNNEKSKQIIDAIFGVGPKDEKFLGTGVYKNYGVVKNGFDIVSNQFSIHYFFKDINIFHNFIRNVSEFCKVGGYFIGTCYDGKKVFKMLKKKKINENEFILKNKKKIWDVVKLYNSDEFKDDHTSLGYEINVYQETINKYFPEYLVNFDFLTNTLEHYGFIPIQPDEYKKFNLPGAISSFSEMFKNMQYEFKSQRLNKQNVGNALNMSSEEKTISFLNNYFVYKKIRNPDAEAISKTLIKKYSSVSTENNAQLTKSTIIPQRKDVKKLKKKYKL